MYICICPSFSDLERRRDCICELRLSLVMTKTLYGSCRSTAVSHDDEFKSFSDPYISSIGRHIGDDMGRSSYFNLYSLQPYLRADTEISKLFKKTDEGWIKSARALHGRIKYTDAGEEELTAIL
jgi:hypothetical protein